jgi:hypothetical protein
MKLTKKILATALTFSSIFSLSSLAEISEMTPDSFTVNYSFHVAKNVSTVHHEFSHVGRWWNSELAPSGKGSNMSFHHECFCEKTASGKTETFMTFSKRERNKLAILVGSIGPLRGKDVKGKMTWNFEKNHHGTNIRMNYFVSGKSIVNNELLANTIDGLLGRQMDSFKVALNNR